MLSRSARAARPRRGAVCASLAAALLATAAPALAGTSAPTDEDAVRATVLEDAASTAAPDDAAVTAPRTPAEARPRPAALGRPLRPVTDGLLPDPESVAREIADELDSEWLGPRDRRAVTVRDALTGQVLAEANADRPVTPASTTKILSAAAIVRGLPVEHTFTTRVVRGATADEVVLVAGGDMLLARGGGDPGAVAGHAGVADLAARTAEVLEEAAVEGPVTVRLDLQHVAGPRTLETWTDFWVSEGYAGRIVQLGLAEDLALPFYPSPRDPEQEVARALATALEDAGVEVAGWSGADAAQGWTAEVVEVPEDAEELAAVESAALRDVLALGLAQSDNAMLEQLARQAAAANGVGVGQEEVTGWVERTIAEDYGIDLAGLQIADASGLSGGTRLTVDVVADLLVAGADGSHPELQSVLAAGGLPIAGYTGTLSGRFHLPVHAAAVGNARAKTGSLPNVTSLAGTVVTADGRLLVYALTADDIGEDGAVLEARSSLDEIVAQLARCGC